MSKGSQLPKKYRVDQLVGSQSMASLAAKLQAIQRTTNCNAFIVVSPSQLDGKTSVAVSLAIEYAHSGSKVALVQANPFETENYFDVATGEGLADLLAVPIEAASTTSAFQTTNVEGLQFLPFGTVDGQALTGDQISRFPRLLELLDSEFDLVLFDGPAMDEGSVGTALSLSVGAALIVVRRNHSKTPDADAMADTFKSIDVDVVGVVSLEG
ncbi:cellulose synthase operon protein YhjQ/BcsQ [Lacticaseibacillus salsurivasis]|uniref:cellulose synthase operon protein YhjQ/BcsQ n=1 Tax=Lacticaseibacillus salsurivasis TaxID=3081441 RepID=UPI0030C6940F